MTASKRHRRSFRVGRKQPCARWLSLAALAAVLLGAFALRHAGLPRVLAAASPDGGVGGLKPKFADVSGVRTRYYEMGQGQPMLLIHGGDWGGSSSANDFSPVLAALAKTFHVFAPDRLGRGLTGNPEDDKDYNDQGEVDFLYRFLQTMKLGPVHIVGHDSGGDLALYLAIEHPEAAKTLIFVAPEGATSAGAAPNRSDMALQTCPPQPYDQAVKCQGAALSWLPTTFDADYWEAAAYMGGVAKSLEAAAKLKAGAGGPLRAGGRAAWQRDMRDRVQNDGVLQMPALVYAGKEDAADWSVAEPTAQLRAALALYDVLGAKNPKVQMIVMNNAGHFLYREHPDEFAADLAHFIDFWEHAPTLQPRMVPMPAFTSSAIPGAGTQPSGVGSDVTPAVAAQGELVYNRYCAGCHEDSENGAPNLSGVFTSEFLIDGDSVTDEHVAQNILKGGRVMPAFDTTLSKQQVDQLVQYLHTR